MAHCTEKNTLEYHTIAGRNVTQSICKKGTLRMGIFFDGTGNDDAIAEEYSNVKKLFDVYTKKDLNVKKKTDTVSAYIRGVGSRQSANVKNPPSTKLTEKIKKLYDETYIKFQDSTVGGGGGFGTGGHARINHMIFELQEAINTFKSDTKFYPKVIKLDVFGFSRGSIQARHFVNVIKQGFYVLNGPYSDYRPKDFVIETLNIFDSVSSFNLTTVLKPFTPLDLGWAYHIKEGWVNKIIHFMADDEYRVHFDGQTIEGSQDLDYPHDINKALRTELVFLGAHSDIGGGYRKKHHGCDNNDLAKIYLNKMYEMAKENGVPFIEVKPTGNDWKPPKILTEKFSDIQSYYKKFSKLKVAHKKFRERVAYLNDPSAGKKLKVMLPNELNTHIANYTAEQARLDAEIAALKRKMTKAQGSRRIKAIQEKDKLEDQKINLLNENVTNKKLIKAYSELKEVFNNDKDFNAFIALSVDFHNTYVHKSHSSLVGAADYDGDGNIIGSRDLAMQAEKDGIFTWYLHRHVYHRDYDDVTKKLCEEKNAQKRSIVRGVVNYTAYRWAIPEKLAI